MNHLSMSQSFLFSDSVSMLSGYRGGLGGGCEPGTGHALVVLRVKEAGGLDLAGEDAAGVPVPAARPELLGPSPV